MRAALLERPAHLHDLGLVLHGAGSGDDHDPAVPDAHAHAEVHHRAFLPGLPGGELVGRQDGDDLLDAGLRLEAGEPLLAALVAHGAEDHALRAPALVDPIPEPLDELPHVVDLLRRG